MNFSEFVADKCKPGEDILASMTADKAHLDHMALGVAGEAGELVDAIKRHTIYGKPLDIDNVVEEIGDILFYMQGILIALYLDMDMAISANMEKLSKRYSTGRYSDQQANARADKLRKGEEG